MSEQTADNGEFTDTEEQQNPDHDGQSESTKVRRLRKMLDDATTRRDRNRIQKLIDEQLKYEQSQRKHDRQVALVQARITQQHRKEDTRRKIIVGGLCLTHAGIEEEFREYLYELLSKHVEERDRHLFPEIWSEDGTLIYEAETAGDTENSIFGKRPEPVDYSLDPAFLEQLEKAKEESGKAKDK